MSDDLEQQLEAWGATSPPPPDPGFAHGLEQSLRTIVVGGAVPGAGVVAARRLGRWPMTVSVGAFAAALIIFGLVVVRSDEQRQIYLTEAIDTQVVLPGGQRIDGAPGVVLEPGSRVITGPLGAAVVGDDAIGPNQDVTIDAEGFDEIEVIASPATTDAPVTSAGSRSDEPSDVALAGPASTGPTDTPSVTAAPTTQAERTTLPPTTSAVTSTTTAPTTTRPPGPTTPAVTTTSPPPSTAPPVATSTSTAPTATTEPDTTSTTKDTATTTEPDPKDPTDTTDPADGSTTTSVNTTTTDDPATSTTAPGDTTTTTDDDGSTSTTVAVGEISATSIVAPRGAG